MKIEELKFSVRVRNCLRRARIETMEQLREQSDDDLMQIRGFGVKCLWEVRRKLGQAPATETEAGEAGGGHRRMANSAEQMAIFRLGQMDMKESILALVKENAEASRDELLELIRGLRHT